MGEMFFPLVFAIFAAHRYVNPKRGEVVVAIRSQGEKKGAPAKESHSKGAFGNGRCGKFRINGLRLRADPEEGSRSSAGGDHRRVSPHAGKEPPDRPSGDKASVRHLRAGPFYRNAT